MADKVTVNGEGLRADIVDVNAAVVEPASGIKAVGKITAHSKAFSDEVSDEFCSNTEYAESEKSLNETPCTKFRFIIKDSSLNKSQDAFEDKLKEEFKKAKLAKTDQSFLISQYDQFENESKFYLKVRTNEYVFDAIR